MEYWNNDLKKMTFLYLIPVKRNFTITQLSILPEPNIPVFQYSIIPIVSEASQLETPSSRFICKVFQENAHVY
jgi:hypothetical protein